MPDEIEKLTVTIEASMAQFSKEIEDGVGEASDAFKKLDKDAQEFWKKRLSRYTKEAGKDIEDFNEKVDDISFSKAEKELGKLDDATKKTGSSFGRFSKAATTGLAGVGVAVGVVTAAFAALGAALVVAFQKAEQGLASVRIQRSFFNLAAGARQAGDEILEAMREATAGTVSEMELMRIANQQLQLGIAKTPEEIAKVTEAAIILGRATGRDAVDSIDRLVAAAGRGSTEVLDELGITLVEVNNEIERLAQQEYGQTAGGLSAAQTQALRLQATLTLAVRKADELGTSIDDVGSSVERANARLSDLTDDFNQANVILVDIPLRGFEKIFNFLFGGDGLFPLGIESSNTFAEAFAVGLSVITAAVDVAVRGVLDLVQVGQVAIAVLKREASLEDLAREAQDLLPAQIAQNAADRFQNAFSFAIDKIKSDYADIFDPGAGASPIAPIIPEAEDDSQKLKEILSKLGTDLLNLQEETNEALEENEQDHSERVIDIVQDAADKRIDAAKKYQRAINDLEEDTARQREDIFSDARRELSELERDTNEDLADERREFETEERRETEDHLTDLRRLREQYLFDLEDAVKERDARAIVDLQRRFRMEQNNRTEDFETQQGRRREDQDEELREIRENERRRSEEILAARERELQDLAEKEERKREDLAESYRLQIEKINEAEQEKLALEDEKYQDRKAQLEDALSERLSQIAKALADEKGITEDGAKDILGALAKYFGKEGEIDKLMKDFRDRLNAKIEIDVEFESSGASGGSAGGRAGAGRRARSGGGAGGRARASFAQGGSMFASSPTLVEFGEAGPELAQFTPLGQMQQSAAITQRSEIDMNLRLSGSAPPGIRSADRDAIAGVMVNALREAGVMSRGR